jgi:fatty acid desaturase
VAFQIPNGFIYLAYWWIVPVLCGYPFINFFRYLEHANCEVPETPNCLRNTRSARSNILIRTLLWDTNFHAEHHCYPMVPFYALHKLNALMYAHVVNNECDHFITQNWMAIKDNGWIAQQQKGTTLHKRANQSIKYE